tara:strand:- start:433 stop:729 length:297 start_codon:yes stop_codon:yes gene_type:complete
MRRKRYTEAFKKQLIALVAKGRTPEQLSREYEPTAQTIRNWVTEAQKRQPASELEKDRRIRELEAENARLKEEREILGKAAAWFAMESTSNRKKGSNS